MIRKFLNTDGELTPLGQKWTKRMAGVFALAIVLMCFLPQSFYPNPKDFSTPGIIQIGRVYLLPTPFNTLVNGSKVESLRGLFWVILQNASNVFLLYPLMLCLIFLKSGWRKWKTAVRNAFFLSLGIESTQLVLDLLIDAGRVVEVDDFWTNALGGLLAYWTYLIIVKFVKEEKA